MKKQIISFILIIITAALAFISIYAWFKANTKISNVYYSIVNDSKEYSNVIGKNSKTEYKDKWGMDESIFPETIENLNVSDFKMIYYDPFDKQYLSYLVVEYDEEEYKKEVKRLTDKKVEDYIGYYGVTEFKNYKLLAMNSDPYYGFVYAITDEKSKIIYVELIFCNYFMDIDYKKAMPIEYLPEGFDASENNSYRDKMLK